MARLNFGLARQLVVVDRYCQLQDTACMKVIPDIVLSEHQKKQNLISIQREDIDENEMHGFILDFNKEWLLMIKEYDFMFDGFMMVKREFVSAIKQIVILCQQISKSPICVRTQAIDQSVSSEQQIANLCQQIGK